MIDDLVKSGYEDLLKELKVRKETAPTSDSARGYAILITEAEKSYAYYMQFLYGGRVATVVGSS